MLHGGTLANPPSKAGIEGFAKGLSQIASVADATARAALVSGLTVTTTSSLNAGAGDITLDKANNLTGAVTVTATPLDGASKPLATLKGRLIETGWEFRIGIVPATTYLVRVYR